jgi:hypothetical protein
LVTLVAAVVLACSTSLLVAVPAEAASAGDYLVGHRCRTYDPAVTNEDTVAALVDTSSVPGAWCEVDTWRIADGRQIIWHDPTWERVADPATLPAGVAPTDAVQDATWAQVSQIRTKGGAPVARLSQMIAASAAYDVPLVVEVQNPLWNATRFVDYAGTQGATVSYYQAPTATCETASIDRLRDAGAVIGIKINDDPPCSLTPWQIHDKGASFVTVPQSQITYGFIGAMNWWGVDVYARWASADTAQELIDLGAVRLLVDRPSEAVTWFS